MLMRAAVLREQGLPTPYAESQPLTVETVTLADPGPGEVLVRVTAAGVCRSDLSAIAGKRARPTPVVAGHEAVGVVEAVGAHVAEPRVGDHVVLVFVAGCGRCPQCRAGRQNLCEASWQARAEGTLLHGTRRLSLDGEPLHHWSGVSAFAEYAVVAAASAIRIDPDIPLLDAAAVGCAVLTGVGAVLNTAAVRPGQTVAVIGLGGVGLSAVMGAAVAGAARIVGIDLAAAKLELARDLGATDLVNASVRPDLPQAVRELLPGVDVAFDMAGA
jgi:alcohol dehydrogenase